MLQWIVLLFVYRKHYKPRTCCGGHPALVAVLFNLIFISLAYADDSSERAYNPYEEPSPYPISYPVIGFAKNVHVTPNDMVSFKTPAYVFCPENMSPRAFCTIAKTEPAAQYELQQSGCRMLDYNITNKFIRNTGKEYEITFFPFPFAPVHVSTCASEPTLASVGQWFDSRGAYVDCIVYCSPPPQ